MDWVFQYNPKTVQTTIAEGLEDWWAARQHIQDISPGDRVYFFRSGRHAAVTAIGELTSAPRLQETRFGKKVVDFKITSIADPPLTRVAIAHMPELADLPVFRRKGQQATNFKLTQEQSSCLELALEKRSWNLHPGDSIRRTDLHRRFGGNSQEAVSPSAQTPNVLLFIDPALEENKLIRDGVGKDQTVMFRVQRGVEHLPGGHEALINHENNRSTLRLFRGLRGTVTYIGAFKLARTPASIQMFELGELSPGAVAYRLRQLDDGESAVGEASGPLVKDVPIEAYNIEAYLVSSSEQSLAANRREAQLVKCFCEYMQALGHSVSRKRITPSGAVNPMYTDLHVEELNLLIEAKGSTERGHFRTAIGQLADYRRFLNRPTCAILIPSKPPDDLIDLASVEQIRLYWPRGMEFEVHEASSTSSSEGT